MARRATTEAEETKKKTTASKTTKAASKKVTEEVKEEKKTSKPKKATKDDEEPVVVDFNYLVRICKTTAQEPDMFTLEDLQELLSKVNTELKAEDVYPQLIQELRK